MPRRSRSSSWTTRRKAPRGRSSSGSAAQSAAGASATCTSRVRGSPTPATAAIAESQGEFIAFIDDDELPAPSLAGGTAARPTGSIGADVVLGPVRPVFEATPARFFATYRGFFTQTSDAATGAVIEPHRPLRLRRDRGCHRPLASNNALIRKASCFVDPEPFAPGPGADRRRGHAVLHPTAAQREADHLVPRGAGARAGAEGAPDARIPAASQVQERADHLLDLPARRPARLWRAHGLDRGRPGPAGDRGLAGGAASGRSTGAAASRACAPPQPAWASSPSPIACAATSMGPTRRRRRWRRSPRERRVRRGAASWSSRSPRIRRRRACPGSGGRMHARWPSATTCIWSRGWPTARPFWPPACARDTTSRRSTWSAWSGACSRSRPGCAAAPTRAGPP